MQLAQSSCTTQARKCKVIDTELRNTQHGFQGGQPSLNPVMGCHPGPPPNSARANKSFHALHGDWAESVLGAERRMAAMQPGRGLGPVAQRTPAALKYGTCSTEISGGNSGRRMLSFWFVVVRQPQTHPDSRRPNLTSSRQRERVPKHGHSQPAVLGCWFLAISPLGTSDQVLA